MFSVPLRVRGNQNTVLTYKGRWGQGSNQPQMFPKLMVLERRGPSPVGPAATMWGAERPGKGSRLGLGSRTSGVLKGQLHCHQYLDNMAQKRPEEAGSHYLVLPVFTGTKGALTWVLLSWSFIHAHNPRAVQPTDLGTSNKGALRVGPQTQYSLPLPRVTRLRAPSNQNVPTDLVPGEAHLSMPSGLPLEAPGPGL